MKLSLLDRVVLVTGGARGIGLATAATAASRGAIPALIDIDGDRAETAAARVGSGAIGLQADVADPDALDAAVREVCRRLGGIDVAVANAGIGPLTTTVDAGDRSHQRRMLDVNLHGVWHTAWATGPELVRRCGHFVVVSSIASFVVTPGWAAYGASKAAIEQLARCMRIELAPTGATVGVAHFGMIDTELVRTFEADTISARFESQGPAPLMRKVLPEDAAEALVRGIERRGARTVYPARWWPLYALRGVLGPVADALLVRHAGTRSLIGELRDRDRSHSEHPLEPLPDHDESAAEDAQ